MIKTDPRQFTTWVLTEEGRQMMQEGSYEVRVFEAVDPTNGTLQSAIMVGYDNMSTVGEMQLVTTACHSVHQKSIPNAKIGFSKAMSSGWLKIDKSGEGGPRVFRKVESVKDVVMEMLKCIEAGKDVNDSELKELKKRKLVTNVYVCVVCVCVCVCFVYVCVVCVCVCVCVCVRVRVCVCVCVCVYVIYCTVCGNFCSIQNNKSIFGN